MPGNHLAPGDGGEDLNECLHVLDDISYKGHLGVEILDNRYAFDPESPLVRTFNWYLETIC